MKSAINKRMTPKQRQKFLAVAEHWGEVFIVYYDYGFMVDAGVVQRANKEQVANHYSQLAADLERLGGQIKAAVDCGDFKTVRSLASEAATMQQEINDRAEEEGRLVTLSARGRELADKYIAVRDGKVLTHA